METRKIIKPGERVDDLQARGYQIIQNPSNFCFGMDAVLLADFVTGKKNAKAMDLCAGNGIVSFLMKARDKAKSYAALEIQEESVDMAKRSVELNGLEESINIIHGDLREVSDLFAPASFDIVTANPPYIAGQSGLENDLSPKNVARHEICCTLGDVVKAAGYLLKEGGTFAMVHKPFRIAEIMRELSANRLEPKRLCMVEPKTGKEPNMVLIEASKGGGVFCKVEPTLTVYKENGEYTEELLMRYNCEK